MVKVIKFLRYSLDFLGRLLYQIFFLRDWTVFRTTFNHLDKTYSNLLIWLAQDFEKLWQNFMGISSETLLTAICKKIKISLSNRLRCSWLLFWGTFDPLCGFALFSLQNSKKRISQGIRHMQCKINKSWISQSWNHMQFWLSLIRV